MINNLQEFYNHITNPLDDDYTIQKMIDAYQQEEYIEEKKDEHQRMYEYFLQRRNNRSGFAERDINFEIPASIFSIENIYKDKDMIPYASYLNYSLRQPFFRCSPNFISNDKDFTKCKQLYCYLGTRKIKISINGLGFEKDMKQEIQKYENRI